MINWIFLLLPLFVSFHRITSQQATFVERFESLENWVKSSATKGESEAYSGLWELEAALENALQGDKGLVVKSAAHHSAISALFQQPLDPKGKPLVIQYEVKLQKGLECGGAYLKLLRYDPEFKSSLFDNKTPYTIMFGPDKCGDTNKVHFIFNHKNPITGEYEEKHFKSAPRIQDDGRTNLYTLIVNPDNTFEILINQKVERRGDLLKDFTPPVNPPEYVDDPADVKPEDWVDNPKMADPSAVKPEDWDDDAPEQIPDPNAEKPDDWLENEPDYIPDPNAVKPEDWDDEEDGDYVAAMVPNPKCTAASGCGEWKRPMIRNPNYRGKWTAPLIDNPAYKGVWKPRQIKNVNYFEDKNPSDFEKIGAIGFELWTMQGDILFDNIYVGQSIEEAQKLAEETYKLKRAAEPAKLEDPVGGDANTISSHLSRGLEGLKRETPLFMNMLSTDPLGAVKKYPTAFSFSLLVSIIVMLVVYLMFAGFTSSKTKETTKEKDDKESEVEEDDDKTVKDAEENE